MTNNIIIWPQGMRRDHCRYLADYSMKQVYNEYMDDLYNLIKVRNVIYYLAHEIGDYPRDEDIRIIYFMCCRQ